MNERIKLPAQEWLGYDPDRGDIHGYTFEQMREFAELIVRECAGLCDQAAEENARTFYTVKETQEVGPALVAKGSQVQAEKLSRQIRQHFGVKE
jgi:hypothetical protein